MTARKPLDITRLTPLQLGLAIATLVLIVAVAAVLIMGFGSASTARVALSSGYLFTDLGNIQRGAYELHLASITLLDEGAQHLGAVSLQYDLLTAEIDAAIAEASANPTMSAGLARLRPILADYHALLLKLERDTSLLLDLETRAGLLDALTRFERSAQNLYDREETRFFQRVSDGLNDQRTSNVLLLLMSVCVAVFSTLLALSLNHSIRYEFERAYNMLETLFRADEELHRNVSVEQVGAALVATAAEMLHAEKAVLFTWDVSRERLIPRVWQGMNSQRLAEQSYGVNDGCLARVLQDSAIVCVEDTAHDPGALQPLTSEEGVRSLVHVPIQIGEQSYGVLTLCSLRPRNVDDDERRLLSALARRAASAIENARLYDRAQVSATMQERQRLARELHDAVTQTLFSASLIAEVLPRIWERSPEAGVARLDELRQLTRGALAEMRTLLLELRPQALLEAEMGELFGQLAEAVTGRSRIPVALDIMPDLDLAPEIKVAFYRIAQEALNNVVKHAGANQIWVSLHQEESALTLRIADDGRGFDPRTIPPTHLGLGIMRERAQQIGATLEIESEIGRGTLVMSRWSNHQEQRQ